MHTFLKPHNCPIDSGTRVDSRFQEPFAEVCGVSSCLWPHSHIGHRLAWNEHAHFTDTERHNKCNKNENSPEWIDQQKYNKIKSHSLYHFGWCSRCAAVLTTEGKQRIKDERTNFRFYDLAVALLLLQPCSTGEEPIVPSVSGFCPLDPMHRQKVTPTGSPLQFMCDVCKQSWSDF